MSEPILRDSDASGRQPVVKRNTAAGRLLVSALVGILLLAVAWPALRMWTSASADAPGGLPVAPLGPLLAEQTRFTSGFCEPRSLRLHAGVDFSTNRQRGMPVLAPAGGWISRIAADYPGYGMQLMLTDSLGRRHLFAHLLSFRADLQAELERAQQESGAYSQALFPAPGRFPVRLGEEIALSGDTGNGPPHLHYELRSATEDRVFNPLRHGLQLRDDLPPSLESLALVPGACGSRVRGSLLPMRVTPRSSGRGQWIVDDTLDCEGTLGLALHAVDHLPGNEARLLPWKLEVVEGRDTLFRLRLDSFPLTAQGESGRVFQRWLQQIYGRPYLRLWGGEGELGVWDGRAAAGLLEPDAAHPVRRLDVLVWDAAENLARLSLTLRLRPAPSPESTFAVPDSTERAALTPPPPKVTKEKSTAKGRKGRKGKRSRSQRARTPAPPPLPDPEWTVLDTGNGLHVRLAPLPPSAAEVNAPVLLGERGEVRVWGQLRNKGWEWVLPPSVVPDGALRVAAPSGLPSLELAGFWLDPDRSQVLREARNGPAIVIYPEQGSVENPARLLLTRGPRGSFTLGPAELSFEKPLALELSLAGLPEAERGHAALFQANERGFPVGLVGGTVEDGRLNVSVTRTGTYVIHTDTRAPSVSLRKAPVAKQKARKGRRGRRRAPARVGYDPLPTLVWEIGGDPSGIALVELRENGRRHYPRYEPDTHLVVFTPREEWPAGSQELELLVRDRSGNEVTARNNIQIIPRRP